MAYFAEIDAHNIVIRVIAAEQDFVDTLDGTWIQTSYNTRGGKHYDQDGNVDGDGLRKNYAGRGYKYDADRDAFIPPQPYASWVLNDDTCWWEAPIELVSELTDEDVEAGKYYAWDEDVHQADNTKGWVVVGGTE